MAIRFLLPGLSFVAFAFGSGCGAKTDLDSEDARGPETREPEPERCDFLDNDLDGEVDEEFRDDVGRYVDDAHCGTCGASCAGMVPGALGTACALVGEVPACVVTACEPGWMPLTTGRACVPWDARLCAACIDDGDCGAFDAARCADVGGELRCTIACDEPGAACPDGWVCRDDRCEPSGGSCRCEPGLFFTLSCDSPTPAGDPCLGTARCEDGVLSECLAAEEICDGRDDDCDGETDEGFRDVRGQYTLDPRHCGACGVDCTATRLPEGELVCGGDPYGPRCQLLCEDTLDGIQPGDRLDADLIVGNGCECAVTDLDDAAGPIHAYGPDLDRNCDGADGVVVRSLYVAPDGNDASPGSPLYPLRTIGEGLRRAAESIDGDDPRIDVFVAAGTYLELVRVPDGVRLHGGYRNDFLGLEPDAFITQVVAPDASGAPGGAALATDRGVGERETVVEGIRFRGGDAPGPGIPAFGAYVEAPGPRLVLRYVEIRAGQGGAGSHGSSGSAGTTPTVASRPGDPPRAAVEDSAHECRLDTANRVAGGPGGTNLCDGRDVGGGAGGSASCPVFGSTQPGGSAGRSVPGASGGMGGPGGWDCEGPVTHDPCPSWICCGLADFTVPGEYELAGDGGNGRDGTAGSPGTACADPLGDLDGGVWTAGAAAAGGRGNPASGGGGGGGGGSARMNWYAADCPFADGLGGGGGGGGAGGCGGSGGEPGVSGAPSIALVIDFGGDPPRMPVLEDVLLLAGQGGMGGRGGAGGDGGLGGLGAPGGEVPRSERTTPTLAGPSQGGHGGKGGNGGSGGGGGGGCGGSSVGVWALLRGARDPGVAAAVAEGSRVSGLRGGRGGRGGPGAAPGADGADGVERDVVVE
jgi:hypothetical protein